MHTIREMKIGASKKPKMRDGTVIAKTEVIPARIKNRVEKIADTNANCLEDEFIFADFICYRYLSTLIRLSQFLFNMYNLRQAIGMLGSLSLLIFIKHYINKP